MNIITQDAKFRLSVVKYATKHSVTKASREFGVCRMTIYRWKKRYDGVSEKSLVPKSRRPHHHPNQHTADEIKLIKDMRRRNVHDGLVIFWVKLRMRGYKRTVAGLYRCMKRMGVTRVKAPNPKYIPKPYAPADYPGQKVQIDAKVVPSACIVGDAKDAGEKMYQYTAIDEYSRLRYIAAFQEQSTYSSMVFLQQLVDRFPFKIETVQTDNGMEFTKRFGNSKKDYDPTLFEQQLEAYGIKHHKIRPYTPRHNGKVERSHRKDNEQFYAIHTFYSFEDFKKQLAVRNREYNNFPMRPLGWKSPNEYLDDYMASVTDD